HGLDHPCVVVPVRVCIRVAVDRERLAGCDPQRYPSTACYADCCVQTFVRGDPPEESQITTRVWVERERIKVDAVMDGCHPVGAWHGPPLRVANRDQRHI